MACPFYHKLCGKCGKNVCRAYFPEKQPYIRRDHLNVCTGDDYAEDCLIYKPAVEWRENRRLSMLAEHCPFAANSYCGKPWLWVCKGHVPPFALTAVVVDERGLPTRNEVGDVVYKEGRGVEDIKETCLSGKMGVYEACPNYKMGMDFREYVKEVKK